MLPMANMLSTSLLVPMSLIRSWVPFSITESPLSVYCGGVAFGSHLMSDGMSFLVQPEHPVMLGEMLTWLETKTVKGPTSANMPIRLTELTIASTYRKPIFSKADEPGAMVRFTVSPLKGRHTIAL